jgi:hypothetical protein
MAKWNIGSCIHNLGISWRCAVSFASVPLYTAADRYATHLIAGWIGHTPSLDTVKSKIFCPAGNWTPFLNHPAHSLVTSVWYQIDTLIQSFKVIWISLKWTLRGLSVFCFDCHGARAWDVLRYCLKCWVSLLLHLTLYWLFTHITVTQWLPIRNKPIPSVLRVC